MATVESILRRELNLRGGRSLEDVAVEACMTPSALCAALQGKGRRFLPPALRLELSELVGTPLPAMDGAGLLPV